MTPKPKPSAIEVARAKAVVARRAPTAPDWVPDAIAQIRANRRARAQQARDDRQRRERRAAIAELRKCPLCDKPLAKRPERVRAGFCRCGV